MPDVVMDWLLAGGAPAFKFETPGDTCEGVIVDYKRQQDADILTGEAKTWKNGDPVFILVLTLLTAYRTEPDDDGLRRIYCRSNLLAGVRDAFRAAAFTGAENPVGGTLKIRFKEEGERTKKGFNPPKLFQVRFVKAEPAPPPSWDIDAGDSDPMPF